MNVMMLPFSPDPSIFQTSKCLFSHGIMGHIDPAQPPSFGTATEPKQPWSSLNRVGFVSQIDIVLPQTNAEVVRKALVGKREPARYSRVTVSLHQILEGDFFKDYIKAGKIVMLSEGRAGQDNLFTLKDGVLTMYLEKEAYERAGLVGKTHGAKGGRGLRPRWVVELDLNSKAMWPGKNGFDRLLYACKNVFNEPIQWLFYNEFNVPDPDPLDQYAPSTISITPEIVEHTHISLPPLERPASLLKNEANDHLEVEETVTELYEWLSLVRLGSPRVDFNDKMDPYLSRYQVPGSFEGQNTDGNVTILRWSGFVSSTWACQTLLDALTALPSTKSWFCMSVSTFSCAKGLASDSGEWTFFRPEKASGEYLLWEVRSHE